MKRLALNLKYLREGKKETQKYIASLLGVSEMTISRYEGDENDPNLENLIRLADHFEVTVDALLRRSFKPPAPMYAENLRFLRIEYEITYEEIAKLLGYRNGRTIEAIEKGSRDLSIKQLMIISEYFGYTLDDFTTKDLSIAG